MLLIQNEFGKIEINEDAFSCAITDFINGYPSLSQYCKSNKTIFVDSVGKYEINLFFDFSSKNKISHGLLLNLANELKNSFEISTNLKIMSVNVVFEK